MNDGSADGADRLDPGPVEGRRAPRSVRSRDADGVEEGYGYGRVVREFLDDALVGRGGSIRAWTTYVGYPVDAGVGVVPFPER